MGGVNGKSKDSLPFQASITVSIADNEPFSFGAKIFVTSDATCLSRNIHGRTVSLQKQGLLYSEDLHCDYRNFDRKFLV